MFKEFSCSNSQCKLPTSPQRGFVIIHGAHAHNLKNVCCKFPKNKLVALTGLSGSGKSSLAVDVLANESIRQLLNGYGLVTDHIQKAPVNTIFGLSPAITISQQVTDINPRSLVGTKTGILTILRNLFATIGHQTCDRCNSEITQLISGKKTITTEEDEKKTDVTKDKKRKFITCPHCNSKLEKPQMAHFSYNTAAGICKSCKGMGEQIEVNLFELLNEDKSVAEGGVKMWDPGTAKHYLQVIKAASNHYNFSFEAASTIKNLTVKAREFLLYGSTSPKFKSIKPPKKASEGKFEGIIPSILTRYKSNPLKIPKDIKDFIIKKNCSTCNGTRLGKIGRETTIKGKTIVEVASLNLSTFLEWLKSLEQTLSDEELKIFASFSAGLSERASHLVEVGLHYISLDRSIPSLSAGEAQRVRLAGALGNSALTGVLYILDEPTTGLHPHNTKNLLEILQRIIKNDNTVLLIEHDVDIIKNADYIIDVGPGRGIHGGEIIAAGTPADITASTKSITGNYLTKKDTLKHHPPLHGDRKAITVRGAREHNLQNIDVSIPTEQFVVLTGVSGSGKSTFLFNILDRVARNYLNRAHVEPGKYDVVEGLENIKRVVTVNQSTIGSKATRSIVATYTKVFDTIREFFASLPESEQYSFTANAFSFNSSEWRCEDCNGAGVVQIDMSFMQEVEMICTSCEGKRFHDNILKIRYRGYNISDILDMTTSEATKIFKNEKKVFDILKIMQRVGLEHVTLGQSTSTLSGGEAQRIKLASELSKTGKEKTLFLLDEPTTGLHPEEVKTLLSILKELAAKGNTVVTIEHNTHAMCAADTIIDFGPGGGENGGRIVAQGTPQEIIANTKSLTGQALKKSLTT